MRKATIGNCHRWIPAIWGASALLLVLSCGDPAPPSTAVPPTEGSIEAGARLVVLGVAQDAGAPQLACQKGCCRDRLGGTAPAYRVSALGVVDASRTYTYLFDATPDLTSQVHDLTRLRRDTTSAVPDGIFLTHAHIGHYTGLMYLGREALGARRMPVYAMPQLRSFLRGNGPWSQLVGLENIELRALEADSVVRLPGDLAVTPLRVPHRDEFSETVGYRIEGPRHSALFIPDIDKWSKWSADIVAEIGRVDYAFLDATFYDGAELNNRDISEIPHPFVIESMALFDELPARERVKVHFIHLNHTNPLLEAGSPETREVERRGYRVARRGLVVPL